MQTITNAGSPSETRKLGEELGRDLKPGSVVALLGDLGAGKTTFVQGLARGLNISEIVTSPTFVIVNEYKIPDKKSSLYHIDLYRTDDISQISDLGFQDIFNTDSIVVIEWAEKAQNLLPDGCIKVNFKVISETERQIEIVGN